MQSSLRLRNRTELKNPRSTGCRLGRIDCQGTDSRSMTRGFVGRCVSPAKLRTRWTWLTSRPTDRRLTALLIDDRYRTLRRHAYPILDLHLRFTPLHESTLRPVEQRKQGRIVPGIVPPTPYTPVSPFYFYLCAFVARIRDPFVELAKRGIS